MKRSSFYGLMFFFVLLYTQGLWRSVGIPKLAVDGTLLALPLAILLSQPGALRKPAPGFLFVWFYVGWALSACIYNDEGIIRGLLYPRFLIASYLVFWAIWSSRFTHRQLLWINTVIIAMFFVQVAAASFNWLVLHRQIEAVVGTMGHETGGIATTFPMFAFSCMLAFFLYYNRPIFLIAGLSFFLVGYASGKLGIYYFIPLTLVLGVVLYAVAEGLPSAIRRSRVIVLIVACSLPFLVFLLSHTHRLETENLQSKVGLYDKIATFFSYTTRQSALESRSWYTTTRVGTSRRVIEETLQRGPLVFLFGQGPHVFFDMSGQSNEGAYDRYGIIYGIVGWSADALAVGWPAMFAHVGFYAYLFSLLRRNRSRGAVDPYWKAIRLTVQLGFFVFLFSYLLYSIHFTVGGWLSSVYLYFLAVMLAPQYQETLRTCSTEGARVLPLRSCRRRASYMGAAGGRQGSSRRTTRPSRRFDMS
jgi:hypothetical protein